MISGVEM